MAHESFDGFGRSVAALAYALAVVFGLILAAAPRAAAQGAMDALKKMKPSQTGRIDSQGIYHLSQEELSYNCKKLTGKMQVRILQIRGHGQHTHPSILSRGLSPLGAIFYGASKGGASPQRYRQDRAMLEAYNRRLAEKKCKTFDLEKELSAEDTSAAPRPVSKRK